MGMDLLQAGVDRSVIAFWLRHERLETTIYLEATIAMKEKALAKASPPHTKPGRYKPGDRLLQFLNNLQGTNYVARNSGTNLRKAVRFALSSEFPSRTRHSPKGHIVPHDVRRDPPFTQ